jgi:hypothetical protein
VRCIGRHVRALVSGLRSAAYDRVGTVSRSHPFRAAGKAEVMSAGRVRSSTRVSGSINVSARHADLWYVTGLLRVYCSACGIG